MIHRIVPEPSDLSPRRRGIVLLVALIALLVSTSICISLTRTILLSQQRLEQRIWKHQADLLAQSALELAVVRLREDPEQTGLEWGVEWTGAEEVTGRTSIQIEPPRAVGGELPLQGANEVAAEAPNPPRAGPGAHETTRIVTITAEVPTDRPERCRSSLRTEIRISR